MTLLRAFPDSNGHPLVPVEIRQIQSQRQFGKWNGKVHRWHRSAEKSA